MSPSIKQKKAIPVFLVALVLACFAISRSAQAAQPLDIQNVNVFNTPFQRLVIVELFPGENLKQESVTIPAGKTLVVEFVSVEAHLPAGEQPIICSFTADNLAAIARVFMNFQASTSVTDFFIGSQQIRLYAKDRLIFAIRRDVGAGKAEIVANVVGYLVNTP